MGFEVHQLDLKHGFDILNSMTEIIDTLREFEEGGAKIRGIIAQPPCTTFAGSGSRWWAPRHNKNWDNAIRKMWGDEAAKNFDSPMEYNQFLVAATEEIIGSFKPDFFVIENPVGRIEEMTGLPKPLLVVQPHHFGAPYTKRTHLWGEFNPELDTANVLPTEGSRAHNLRSTDEKDEGLRSLTPEGFAYAFALANAPGVERVPRLAEGGPAPLARAAEEATETVTPEAPADIREGVKRFASGMSRTRDLDAGGAALGGSDKMGVGVEIGELSSKTGMAAIARAVVDWGADVFIDTGAFPAFRRGKTVDFDKVLERFDEIEERVFDYDEAEGREGRIFFVMPDVVGNQRASLDLLRKHQAEIAPRVQAAAGGALNVPIVPLQKGERSISEAFDEAAEILGTREFVVGVPSNEAALSLDELRDFLETSKPEALHFLGAASEKNLGPKLDVVNEVRAANPNWHPHVTADANLLRSKMYGRSEDTGTGRAGMVIDTLTREDLEAGSRNARYYEDEAPAAAPEAPPAQAAPAAPPPAEAAPAGGLDLGEAVDPNLAAKQAQELDLAAQQPLLGGRKTGQAQNPTMPEGLFGGAEEPALLDAESGLFDLGDGKGPRSAEEIDADIAADEAALDAIKGCLL